MKKYIILLILVLSLLLFACEKVEEKVADVENSDDIVDITDTSEIDETLEEETAVTTETTEIVETTENDYGFGAAMQIDKSKIVISDEFELFQYVDWLPEVPANSYAIVRSYSYEGRWIRAYAVYYPNFTEEIKYEGSDKIKQYYAELVEKEYKSIDEWGTDEIIIDEFFDYTEYYYKTYGVNFFNKYLSVRYFDTNYMGGAHSYECVWCDNFDMTTGEILTLKDLFGDKDTYRPILYELICKNLLLQHKENPFFENPYENPDIMDYIDNSRFHITENGIEFIFQVYEIAPYASGTIFVTVPYEELSEILLIQIGE